MVQEVRTMEVYLNQRSGQCHCDCDGERVVVEFQRSWHFSEEHWQDVSSRERLHSPLMTILPSVLC